MTAYIFDTETTGTDTPDVVEAAWLKLSNDLPDFRVLSQFCERYKPSKPISLGALAVHHILDEELEDCPPSSSFKLPDDAQFIIGHNVDYDWQAIGKPDVKRICTLSLSRYLLPELDTHSQSAMYYYFFRDDAKNALRNAHNALIDVQNCARLLQELINKLAKQKPINSWEDLWLLSEEARIPKIMPFGKHKGMLITELPASYCEWVLKQDDFDPYLIKAIKSALSAK